MTAPPSRYAPGFRRRTAKEAPEWARRGGVFLIRSFIHILIANRAKIKRHGCPVGTLCTELAKLDHASQSEANKVFALFRAWLRRQFTLLGRKSDADALAMHLLARSQGVATLANAFHDEKFIRREVEEMCDWAESCAKAAAPAGRARGRQ